MAVGPIKMNRVWLMCMDAISALVDRNHGVLNVFSSISSPVIVFKC